MKNRKVLIALVVLAGLSVLAGGLGCSSEKRETPPAPEVVSNVSVLPVQRAVVPDYYEAVGTVRAAQTSQLASQIMGTITSIAVHEGDHVRRGQVLAVIDEAQPKAGLEQANAALAASQQSAAAADANFALAEATYKRYQDLYAKKSVSPQEFDEVKARYSAAMAQREAAHSGSAQAVAGQSQARTMYDFTRVRAPFEGFVTAKLVDVGTMATPGTPIIVVEDPSRFRLEATVDESAMGAVHLGQKVPVTIDVLGDKQIEGKVVQIVPAADPMSRTFLIKVELPRDPQIRSGLFGRARFARGERDSMTVPKTAVFTRGQLSGVYVVGNDQIAELRYITLGQPSGDSYEVLSGLENGERVVVSPAGRELAGRKIQGK